MGYGGMGMRVVYDPEADILSLHTDGTVAMSASLLTAPDVVLDLDTEDGYGVVGLMVMWADALGYLGLEQGYDAEADTLLLGTKVDDPNLVTENGDLVAYWQASPGDEVMDPVGALVRNASIHLDPACVKLL